jgi:hypothetical protein
MAFEHKEGAKKPLLVFMKNLRSHSDHHVLRIPLSKRPAPSSVMQIQRRRFLGRLTSTVPNIIRRTVLQLKNKFRRLNFVSVFRCNLFSWSEFRTPTISAMFITPTEQVPLEDGDRILSPKYCALDKRQYDG